MANSHVMHTAIGIEHVNISISGKDSNEAVFPEYPHGRSLSVRTHHFHVPLSHPRFDLRVHEPPQNVKDG